MLAKRPENSHELVRAEDYMHSFATQELSALHGDMRYSYMRAVQNLSKLDEFRLHLPLLVAMTNPGLRERHWNAMSSVVGFSIEPDDSMTLALWS